MVLTRSSNENVNIMSSMIFEAITIGGTTTTTTILLSNPFFVKIGLIGLFINSLLSSVIPIPTELTTSGLLLAGQSKMAIFITLVSGSIIGGFIAYYIGCGGISFLRRFRKKPNKKSEYRGASLLKKYGWVILFISPWIPIIGDYIPIIAGASKYNLKLFSIAIVSGKVVKGVAIVYIGSLILPSIFPSAMSHT
jgi:membrane protein YqaA with SNARE-associated domain